MNFRYAVASIVVLLITGANGWSTPILTQAGGDDPVRVLVSRLTLDNYKDTLAGLTQFGDRRQGTQRNRDAVDWIEEKLQEFGCTNTERVLYTYESPQRRDRKSVV